MTAKEIAGALGGRKMGAVWMARCPTHDDREPSLSIRDADDGKVLVRCHAGCDQQHVIAELRARSLWANDGFRSLRHETRSKFFERKADQHDANRSEFALSIWYAARSAQGSLVEIYLASRGIHLSPPGALCFHAGLRHPAGGFWPAMVALVTNGVDETPLGIHRTFLARNGNGKAPIEPAKMMLGPCRGGAVRLADAAGVLMVGEGIETCLSAMQATGIPAWAALSTSGLRTLGLPDAVKDIIILADGDDAGEAAARDAALRWEREGRRIRIARPPRGMDFNDLLRVGSPAIPGNLK